MPSALPLICIPEVLVWALAGVVEVAELVEPVTELVEAVAEPVEARTTTTGCVGATLYRGAIIEASTEVCVTSN